MSYLSGDEPKECLDAIRQEMNKDGQKSPELAERLWRKVARRFGVTEPQAAAGIVADGIAGPVTEAAIRLKLDAIR